MGKTFCEELLSLALHLQYNFLVHCVYEKGYTLPIIPTSYPVLNEAPEVGYMCAWPYTNDQCGTYVGSVLLLCVIKGSS